MCAPGLVHHQQAGGDAGAVEQVAGQADDGLQIAVLDKVLARLALFAAAKQHTMGHDGGHAAIVLEHRQHVLDKHQVGLFALLRHHHRETAGEFQVFFDVVLAERRIGDDAVEAFEFVALIQVLRFADGVFLADVGMGDAVQQHVHLADGPGGAVFLLAVERQFIGIAALFTQVVAHLDQHAAGTDGGVVDAHALFGVTDFDAEAHHFGGGVELTGLLAGGIGEVFDQPFIGGAQQIGEFKVVVLEGDLLEVLYEVGQGVVIEGALADLAVEVDALEHVFQRVRVGILDGLQRLVQISAYIFLDVLERRALDDFLLPVFHHLVLPTLIPAGAGWYKEVFARVVIGIGQLLLDILIGHALRFELLAQLGLSLVEQVAGPLEEQHAEDVFLVFTGVHAAAQIVAGGEQQAFETRKG